LERACGRWAGAPRSTSVQDFYRCIDRSAHPRNEGSNSAPTSRHEEKPLRSVRLHGHQTHATACGCAPEKAATHGTANVFRPWPGDTEDICALHSDFPSGPINDHPLRIHPPNRPDDGRSLAQLHRHTVRRGLARQRHPRIALRTDCPPQQQQQEKDTVSGMLCSRASREMHRPVSFPGPHVVSSTQPGPPPRARRAASGRSSCD